MDFLSIILAAFGWQKDRSNRISDRRTEAYRLNAEVAAEVLSCLTLITGATPSILRRLSLLCPAQSTIYRDCAAALAKLRADADQLYALTQTNRQLIENGSSWADWDKLVRQLHEWRATATTLRPYNEAIIKRFEDMLTAAEAQPPDRLAASERNGWDAPPL